MQDAIIEAALAAFETLESPGEVHRPAIHWDADDAWKDALSRLGDGENAGDSRDDRTERSGSPQYQLDADRVAAEGAQSRRDREL